MNVIALKSVWADIIWIETISALDELKAAIDAANRTGLPTCCTLSFDTHRSTMMGMGAETLIRFCEDSNLAFYGRFCFTNKKNINLPNIAKKEIVVSLRIKKEK